jgi:hypothetical protein
MTTTNLWKRLKQLLPDAPLLVGTVDSVSAYGAIVELPDGSLVSVRGDATLGQQVFIRDGVIEGTAPTLTTVVIEI